MNKEEYKKHLKKRKKQEEDGLASADAVLPVHQSDMDDELEVMDTFREHERDLQSQREGLTSDEG